MEPDDAPSVVGRNSDFTLSAYWNERPGSGLFIYPSIHSCIHFHFLNRLNFFKAI